MWKATHRKQIEEELKSSLIKLWNYLKMIPMREGSESLFC